MDGFIKQGSMLRIEDGRGVQLHVRSGALWVTQRGDRRDYYLKAGETFRAALEGAVLVQALEPASVAIVTPAQPQPGGRLGGLLQRMVRLWTDAFVPGSRPTSAAL